ncbi:MAG TPA: STAS domain-containing protein [Solirubrobacterales bacterium]|nr:STAS domain-containing protein [Solirubrobacterales bacterium]
MADDSLLRVEVEHPQDGVAVIALRGECDLSTIPRLEALLFEELESPGAVIVDLTGLSFIDSSGMGLLIKAHQASEGTTHLHTVIARGSQVDRVFDVTGISHVLAVFYGRDEALAALAARNGSRQTGA